MSKQLAIEEVILNPSLNKVIIKELHDPRWANKGWKKYTQVIRSKKRTGYEFHFLHNAVTNEFDDFKFIREVSIE